MGVISCLDRGLHSVSAFLVAEVTALVISTVVRTECVLTYSLILLLVKFVQPILLTPCDLLGIIGAGHMPFLLPKQQHKKSIIEILTVQVYQCTTPTQPAVTSSPELS